MPDTPRGSAARRHGDRIIVRDAAGRTLTKRILDGPPGRNFPVIWACSEEEWALARSENRDPVGMAWPLEDVVADA